MTRQRGRRQTNEETSELRARFCSFSPVFTNGNSSSDHFSDRSSSSHARSRSRSSSNHPSSRHASPSHVAASHSTAHEGNSHDKLVPLRELLYRHLEKLPAENSDDTPAMNEAAKKRDIHLRHLQIVEYASFNLDHHVPVELVDQDQFRKFVFSDKAPFVPWFPQVTRVLAREADVAGAYLSNVLNPVVAILQELIDPRFRHILKVVIASQYEAYPEDKKEGASSSKLDEVITLMSWPIGASKRLFKEVLFICEEKRPGYILAEDWTRAKVDNATSRARKLTPQVIMYASNFECEDFCLSDYHESIAVKINVSDALNEHATIRIGIANCDGLVDSGHSNPLLALVWTGVIALDKLGILDRHVRGEHATQRPLAPSLQNYLGAHRLVRGRPESPTRSGSPVISSTASGSGGPPVPESPAAAQLARLTLLEKERGRSRSRSRSHSRSHSRHSVHQ